MARPPNYKKWNAIYIDHKNGMTWDELVSKYKTSKRTIGRAVNFFREEGENFLNNQLNDDLRVTVVNNKIKELEEELNKVKSERDKIIREKRSKSDIQNIQFNDTQQIIKILESLSNSTRIWLMIILNVYKELGVGKLSKMLGISKTTALRHLKFLKEAGLIKIREEKIRGPKLKQYFSVIVTGLDVIEKTRLSRSLLRTLSPEQSLKTHKVDLNLDILLFSIINKIINEMISYYKEIQKYINEFKPQDHKTIENIFSSENYSRYYLWVFNEEQFNLFKKRYRTFFEELRKDLKILESKKTYSKTAIKPFLVWHMLVPIKKIIDYL